jgi:hypothetical protein
MLSSNLLSSQILSENLNIRILTLVLYGPETRSQTLKEELRMRVFHKRMLKRMFGLKGEVVTGGMRKLHNEELHNL